MRILETTLLSDDLESTRQLYHEVLGLPLHSHEENAVAFRAGDTKLIFRRSIQQNPVHHFAFNIPHNQLDESVEWMLEKAMLITNEHGKIFTDFPSWNARSIYFCDNNQNILEFIARFDLPNESDQRFNADSLLSISEMGVVTSDPKKLAEELIEKYHLNYFDKGPVTEDFVVLGDDFGLLIISSPDRNWYPTEYKAEEFPVNMNIDINGTKRLLVFNE
jgi:catechol 2,3-dioxygenase-like lactoylglutathione lyase family enzyme